MFLYICRYICVYNFKAWLYCHLWIIIIISNYLSSEPEKLLSKIFFTFTPFCNAARAGTWAWFCLSILLRCLQPPLGSPAVDPGDSYTATGNGSCANFEEPRVHVYVCVWCRGVFSMLLRPFFLSYFSPVSSPHCNSLSLVTFTVPFPTLHFSTNGCCILQRKKLNNRNPSHVLPP